MNTLLPYPVERHPIVPVIPRPKSPNPRPLRTISLEGRAPDGQIIPLLSVSVGQGSKRLPGIAPVLWEEVTEVALGVSGLAGIVLAFF
jgi:hypothetical protein